MRIVRRPLVPRQTDYELVWFCVSIVALAFAATWFAAGLPWPHCIFLTITGHPCLTCGATRSAIAFFHLDLARAWEWNPLVFTFLCGLSIFDVYAFAVLATRTPRLRIVEITAVERKSLRALVVVLLLANWIYLLSRGPGLY